MELGTFGAVFTFALRLEKRAADFYENAAHGPLAELFADRAKATRKRINRLERTQRESVTEMILEAITGLDGDDYRVDRVSNAHEAAVLAQAIAWEETLCRFYLNAGERMPVREVARIFERMARENEQRRAELREIQTKG